MRLYAHHKVDRYGGIENTAWINRISRFDRNDEREELWLVWLPSYGMEYHVNCDRELWSQRGFMWNLRTGKFQRVAREDKVLTA